MFAKCFGRQSESSDESTDTRLPSKSQIQPVANAARISQNKNENNNGVDNIRSSTADAKANAYACPARAHEVSLPVVDVIAKKEKETTLAQVSRRSIFRKSLVTTVVSTPGPVCSVIIPSTPSTKEKRTFTLEQHNVSTRTTGTQTIRRHSSSAAKLKIQRRTSRKEMNKRSSSSSESTESCGSDHTSKHIQESKLRQIEQYEYPIKPSISEHLTSSFHFTEGNENEQRNTAQSQTIAGGMYAQLVEEESIEENEVILTAALPKVIRAMLNPNEIEISTVLEDILYFRQECLEAHNKHREKHNVEPLILDTKICNYAQVWANDLAESGHLNHETKFYYGSNLFKGLGTTYTAKMIVKEWYNEVSDYNFSKPGLADATGHFTQIVWADTKKLGVGMRKRNGYTYVICIYEPPGNIINKFEDNVMPPAPINEAVTLSKAENNLSAAKFAQACLESHNKFRQRHGSPPLKINEHMNAYAREWARQLAKYGFVRHRPNNKYGENLFLATNYDPSAEEVVEEWYSERQMYDYHNPTFTENTGNFTQLVWRHTTELGVGIAKIGKSTYVVCNYAPRGNAVDHFISNVLSPAASEITIEESSEMSESDADIADQCSDILSTSTFEEKCLEAHNKYRTRHNCPPLILNQQLCKFAQEWANHLSEIRTLQHRPNNTYGENLYYTTAIVNGEEAVKAWYNEIKFYNFDKPGFHSTTCHFTQLIWKKSRHLGVGKTVRDNFTFVVCNYQPAGNVINHFEHNVPPNAEMKRTKDKPQPSKSLESSDIRSIELGGTFEERCLKIHNKYRALHGCPPLRINRSLNLFALEWAKYLHMHNKLQHRPNNMYGENLYYALGFQVHAEDVVTTWYNEVHDYDFKNPQFSPKTSHFAQLIWKTSRELGVAAINIHEATYVVCNYSPPGNLIGRFENNVPPPFLMRTDIEKQEKKMRQTLTRTSMFTNQLDPITFAEDILKRHNELRAQRKTPSVELNDNLNDIATEWANYLANTDSLKNRESNQYGENLFRATGWNVTPEEIMNYWNSESANYRPEDPSPSNFTQIVWKNTKYIGVGIAKRGDSTWIVVNYEPAGNIAYQYKENVLPAIKRHSRV